MGGNVVEVVFRAQDSGLLSVIDQIRNRMPEITSGVQKTGAALDSAFAQGATRANETVRQLENVNQKLREAQNLTRQLAIEESRLRNASSPVTGGFDPLGSAPGRAGAGTAAGRAVSGANQFDLSRAAKEARDFDAQMLRVTQGTDNATASQTRFWGATIIGTQVLRQFGIEGSRAIEIVGNQLVSQEGSFRKIITSNQFGFTVAIAGAFAFGEAINHVFTDIRKQSEAVRDIIASMSSVNLTGIQGGSSTQKNELQRLFELRDDVRKLSAAGLDDDARRLVQETLGRGFGVGQLDSRIEQAKRRAEILGLDTRSNAEIEQAKKLQEFDKKRAEDAQALFRAKIEGYNREDEILKQRRAEDQRAVAAARQFFGTALNASLAGSDARTQLALLDAANGQRGSADAAARAAIEQQIFQGRAAGTLSPQQQLALIAQFSAIGTLTPEQRAQQESVTRQIEIARQFSAAAVTPEQREAALQAGIRATSGGNLTEDQAAARRAFLEQLIKNQPDLIQSQLEHERQQQISQDKFVEAVNVFAEAIKAGIGLDVNVKSADDTRAQVTGKEPSPFDRSFGDVSNNF